MSIKATLRARKRRKRILYASLAVAVLAIMVVAYFVAESFNDPYAKYIGEPVSSSLFQSLASFSSSTLSAVGGGTAKPPSAISGGALQGGGKPLILYIGGEYCPYCAVTRWSMIVALSKFGSFSGLQYMLSSASDTNANSPTFTFAHSNYSSPYITFIAVEAYDRSDNPYQTPTSNESALYSQYDPGGGIPFIDFANKYLVTGVSGGLSTLDLSGMNWTQVYDQLTVPGSQTAQAVIGEASYMISTICAIDGGQPASICSAAYSTLSLAAPAAGGALQAIPSYERNRSDLPWTD